MMGRIGQQFGNYRLLRLIGHGGFADVYLGEHIYMGTQAAIKVLHTRLGSNEVERFRQEASLVAHLEHPHIVRVFEFGVQEATPYLVLSYASNGTLRERYPKGSVLPLPTVIPYVRQLADALQYAHDERVIHRDIKPENMLLGKRNEVLLSDFGIALISHTSRSQSLKDLAGTAAYIAPEQIEAHPRPTSDQYSLAIVVYEWLCGFCPFQGTFTEVVLKHTVVPPPSLCERQPGIPSDVEHVIFTALSKDPTRRFASIRAFAQALEQASRQVISARGDEQSPLQALCALPRVHPDIAGQGVLQQHAGLAKEGEAITARVSSSLKLRPDSYTPPLSSPGSPVSFTPVLAMQETEASSDISQEESLLFPPATVTSPDAPPPLQRFSRKRIILSAILLLLVISGSVFGAIQVFRKPVTNTQPKKGTVAVAPPLSTAILRVQASQQQAIDAYNQEVATGGIMSGFDPQHTRVNPYEAILSATSIHGIHQVWSVSAGLSTSFSSPVLGNGLVYVGSHDKQLHAFDALTGRQVWASTTGERIDSSPALANGLIYVGSKDNNLYAFDALSGRRKWLFSTNGSIDSSPTVVGGVLYIGSRDGKLYALDAITGKEKWAAIAGSSISYSAPAVANGLVYIGSTNSELYAFDAATGAHKWFASTGGGIDSSPTIMDGWVYIPSSDGKLYAFNAVTGKKRWTASTNDKIISSPAIRENLVYVSSSDGSLYAFDVTTGKQKWAVSTGSVIEASPLIANGLVYVGSFDKHLYAFDATTGQEDWESSTNSKIYSSPLVANGMIYTGAGNGKLYAFSLLK